MSTSHTSFAAWEHVWWPLALAPGTLGSLDWVSGAVFLAADSGTIERIQRDDPRSDSERELDRTRVHEVFHYMQVLTTGFLYNWVELLTKMTRAAIAHAAGGREIEGLEDLGPSLSTSGETLIIEESMTLRARTENAGHAGDEHEWSWSSG